MWWKAALIVGIMAGASSPAPSRNKGKPVSPPPIVQTNIPALAREFYGSWAVDQVGAEGYEAFTVNAAKSNFGLYCAKGCLAYLSTGTNCDSGHIYPALIGSSGGSLNITFKCIVLGNTPLLTFELSDTLVDIFETAGEIGIVFPLKSGEFQVTRFSLTGALKASRRAYALSGASADKDSKPLSDYKL